jgi:hypothetical protein
MKYSLVLFFLILIKAHIAIENKLLKNLDKNSRNINPNQINQRVEEKCNLCLEKVGEKCHKCMKGSYLYKSECYNSCPDSTVADNYSLSCKNESESPVFIKAYTLGRCMNKCGGVFKDCSCHSDCKKTGTCCSDYKYCEYIEKSALKKCKIKGCEACTSDNKTCLKCREGLSYYKNKCVVGCPKGSKRISGNSLCVDIPKCSVENCAECDKENTNCVKCLHGFFLHENECTKSCPSGTRANRADFTCVNKSTFAFSMIFPSKHSCKNHCGLEKGKFRKSNANMKNDSCDLNTPNADSDCSCHHHCLKDGNCCDDFESECVAELKKEKCKACADCHEGKCLKCSDNSSLKHGDCNCFKGFYYDIHHDKCLNMKDKIKNVSGVSTLENNNDNNSMLSKMLADSFNSEKSDSYKQGLGMNGLGYNMVLSGNTKMNIFSGNDHPTITTENVVNENSFNNVTKIEHNINSHNILVGGYQREVTEEVENGKGYYPEEREIQEVNEQEEAQNGISEIRDAKGRLIRRIRGRPQTHQRKKKIIIDKHLHLDHGKNFPEDLEHEEGVPMEVHNVIIAKKEENSPKNLTKKEVSKENVTMAPNLGVKSVKNELQLKTKSSFVWNDPNVKNPELNNPPANNSELNEKDEKDFSESQDVNKKENTNSKQLSVIEKSPPKDKIKAKKPIHLKTHKTGLHEVLSEQKNHVYKSHPSSSQISSNETLDKTTKSILAKKPSKLKEPEIDNLVETTTDANKKVQVNINIPNLNLDKDDKNPNVIHRNKVVVYNHYFINDKSMTMHKPKNPNVFNFFSNECKDGKCASTDDGKPFKNAQFISDKNFKEFNKTLNVEKSGVNIFVDRGGKDEKFDIPESQKDLVAEDLMVLRHGENNLR